MLWCEQTSRICSRFFTAKQGSAYRVTCFYCSFMIAGFFASSNGEIAGF